MTRKRKRARKRRRSLGGLAWGGLAAAVVVALIVVGFYGATGGGGGSDVAPEVGETPSESHGVEPFQGGPRIHFPVKSVDFGQVPFNKEVSYAFELKNVGDATLRIEDVKVRMLEGC